MSLGSGEGSYSRLIDLCITADPVDAEGHEDTPGAPFRHVGSEGRRGRWGTPTMALHIRIQHREQNDNEN